MRVKSAYCNISSSFRTRGSGACLLWNIYEFLCDEEKIQNDRKLLNRFQERNSHTGAIVEAAFHPQHSRELCLAKVDLLV